MVTTTQRIATCPDCGQRNRLPLTVPAGKRTQCGRCHEPLEDDDEDDEDDE